MCQWRVLLYCVRSTPFLTLCARVVLFDLCHSIAQSDNLGCKKLDLVGNSYQTLRHLAIASICCAPELLCVHHFTF